MSPELSVIVPCHNEAATLADQLEALVAQDVGWPWEVLVVNNQSTDETVSVALSFEHRLPLRVIEAPDARGVAHARNVGVKAALSDRVAFCDGDDVVAPGWLNAMRDALTTNPLVTGPVETSSLNADDVAKSRPASSTVEVPRFGQIGFARGNNTGLWISAWKELDGYNETFDGLEDIEFSLRAAAMGYRPNFAPDALVAYRFRPGLGALWKQGIFYGRGRPSLVVLAHRLGIDGAPGRLEGLRSWAWMLVHSPRLARASTRPLWIWVLANRVGVLRGAVRLRSLYV